MFLPHGFGCHEGLGKWLEQQVTVACDSSGILGFAFQAPGKISQISPIYDGLSIVGKYNLKQNRDIVVRVPLGYEW